MAHLRRLGSGVYHAIVSTLLDEYGLRRTYDATPAEDGATALRLSDRVVDLGPREHAAYVKLADLLPTNKGRAEVAAELGMDEAELARFVAELAGVGLLYRAEDVPSAVSGEDLHRAFQAILPSWLSEAFSHPFWDRMMSGRGSRRLFSGWLIELYHYTRNANRHMPLSCAYARDKPLRVLRARHYGEEWNHYHYFTKSLRALGFTDESVASSVPLPMTLALSNFMRQAAREDVLAYSICSAVLEGTTTDRGAYSPYYEKTAELYGIPREAVAPIYAHLDLDVQYQHADLFAEILKTVDVIPRARASRVLDYGHQLVEHIWMWTENIERYYELDASPLPRRAFDPALD
jgi:pyrroloquinoline quinone (PQQ) biosynthesis protein C